MSSIVVKMFTISPYFWTMESPYLWLHRVGSPETVKASFLLYLMICVVLWFI